MHGLLRVPCRRRQSRRRQFRYGQRAAVLRAITAAKLYRDRVKSTLELAALSCGSNVKYVQAALIVMQSEDNLLDCVLAGDISMLAAARDARRLADLMTAYRRATPQDLAALGRMITPDKLFTDVIEPAL